MITIGQVIEQLSGRAPQKEPTVDALRYGSAQTIVTGIVVVFVATQAGIEQAAALGANMIISHEGTFYRHLEDLMGPRMIRLLWKKAICLLVPESPSIVITIISIAMK